jgi:hypothetical protein
MGLDRPTGDEQLAGDDPAPTVGFGDSKRRREWLARVPSAAGAAQYPAQGERRKRLPGKRAKIGGALAGGDEMVDGLILVAHRRRDQTERVCHRRGGSGNTGEREAIRVGLEHGHHAKRTGPVTHRGGEPRAGAQNREPYEVLADVLEAMCGEPVQVRPGRSHVAALDARLPEHRTGQRNGRRGRDERLELGTEPDQPSCLPCQHQIPQQPELNRRLGLNIRHHRQGCRDR